MKFQVGSWYSFIIENISDVPEKGSHYVLKHESGRKMLLKVQHYVKYNFIVGQTIECRVDKVNCTGQVFLEPRHPYYNEGSLYGFKFLGIKSNEDNTLSQLVKDSFDNEIQVFLSTMYELIASEVILKVEIIKKGIPILSIPTVQNISNNLDDLDIISLKVVAIVTENSEEYYSLADGSKNIKSRLKVKHYKHYGLKVGSSIICQKRGYDSNGLIIVEPENPWYKIGESYLFKINSLENYTDLDGEEVKSVIVLDANNNKCGVIINSELLKQIDKQIEVKCKVVGFRKGRPQLEIDL